MDRNKILNFQPYIEFCLFFYDSYVRKTQIHIVSWGTFKEEYKKWMKGTKDDIEKMEDYNTDIFSLFNYFKIEVRGEKDDSCLIDFLDFDIPLAESYMFNDFKLIEHCKGELITWEKKLIAINTGKEKPQDATNRVRNNAIIEKFRNGDILVPTDEELEDAARAYLFELFTAARENPQEFYLGRLAVDAIAIFTGGKR